MAKRLIILLPLFLILSCATTMPSKKDLEASLRESAERYWEIRLKGDLGELYDMEYEEDLPAMDKYKVKAGLIRKIIITKYRINEIIVEGNKGTVYVQFYITIPPAPEPFKQTMHDKWIWDGKWKHILEPKKEGKKKG